MNLYAKIEYVNKTQGHYCGCDEWFETAYETTGELYRNLIKEYGRCTSKMYIDTESGAQQTGWVFEKRMEYDDCNETYLQEAWVTVSMTEPHTVTSTENITNPF